MVNTITISGRVIDVQPSHVTHTIKMYCADIDCPRLSGRVDHFKVFFDDRFYRNMTDYILVTGDIRECTFGSNTIPTIHAYSIQWMNEDTFQNDVELEGIVVRASRIKYSNNIPFSEIVIRCDRDNGYKSDFIQCVVWGLDAMEVCESGKDKMIHATGRLQNKKYGTQVSIRSLEWK